VAGLLAGLEGESMGITNEEKLTARIKKAGRDFIEFDLTIYDDTISGELIMPRHEFWEFIQEQKVTLLADSEEDRLLIMAATS
jgi:hypothetical protein